MKKVSILFIALMGMVAASCSNDESLDSSVNLSSEQAVAPVTVSVNVFAVEQADFPGTGEPQGTRATTRALTRAQSVSDYAGVKFLTMAFYASDGTEVFKQTQKRDDASTYDTFGEFSTTLKVGDYTMVVVANSGSIMPTLTSATSATYGEDVVGDTFANTQTVNITSTAAVNLNATLERIVSGIAVHSSDGRADEAKKLRITTTTGGRSFSPTTGLATVNTGLTAIITHTEAVDAATRSAALFFLASDEQTADVTLESLDADDNVLFSTTLENVPLKRNRLTVLTGALYSNASVSAGSFQVNTDWLSGHNIEF